MSNLNEGVGKKIVEALKKQSEMEASVVVEPIQEQNNLGVDVSALDEITNQGLLDDTFDRNDDLSDVSEMIDMFADNDLSDNVVVQESFNDFMNPVEKQTETAAMPSNIIVLKKLISQLPSGVTRHTGAQIIKQTMEALGISMKSVLTEAQDVQANLKESSKECQMLIQEYKRKITALEKQTQNFQKQYSALNDLISLFIQTTK